MNQDYLQQQLAQLDKKIAENKKLLEDPELAALARTEIEELEVQKQELAQDEQASYDEADINPNLAILEIRSAAGGDEAGLFAQDLLRMYLRFAESKHWQVVKLNSNPITLQIKGNGVFSDLKYEAGVHRVQRVPKTESSGRIHTSTATVAVLPEVAKSQITINPADLEFEAFRSGGAGGQNVNKVSTAVRIKHIPSGLVVTCQTERSQLQNRENAMALLRAKLWEAEQEQKAKQIGGKRSAMVGTGERNEKIRTYNFPQNRVTDHRINKSWHNLEDIIDGNLQPLIKALKELDQS